MNKITQVSVGIVIVAIIAGIVYVSTGKEDAIVDTKTTGGSSIMEDKDAMMEADAMMESGSYEAYAQEKLARAEKGDVVLFFHASWCPSCRGLNADIEKSLKAIPAETSILKVDYDTATELKKRYGVTYQHTLIQVDKDGNMIKKWSGSPTLNSLISEIN